MAQKFIYVDDAPLFLRAVNALGLGSPDSLRLPFLVVLALLVADLGASSVNMARKARARGRAARDFRGEDAMGALANNSAFHAPAGARGRLQEFFRRRGYSEAAGGETRLHACKRLAGYRGSLLFHLTFFVILLGVLLSALTRQVGYFELSPGEVFTEGRENYLQSLDSSVKP